MLPVVGHVLGLHETLRVRAATANVALTLMKYTYIYIYIYNLFFFTRPDPSTQISTRPHVVLPVHKTDGRVSA